MKLATISDRLCLVDDHGARDVESLTEGVFGPDIMDALRRWDEFTAWVVGNPQRIAASEVRLCEPEDLGAPVPAPRQVFAVGLNYKEHAVEAGLGFPEEPQVFCKFPSSIVGPSAEVELPSSHVDWEVELVVVIGRQAHCVDREQGWDHVAGFMVGQDISEREVQFQGPAPQFCLAKSYPGFSPTGPWLVTPDEVPDRGSMSIQCTIAGETLQRSSTDELIFDVPELVARLSAIVTLFPGDLIFTGTPSGIGNARSPQRFLCHGEELVSRIGGVGEIRTRFTGPVTETRA